MAHAHHAGPDAPAAAGGNLGVELRPQVRGRWRRAMEFEWRVAHAPESLTPRERAWLQASPAERTGPRGMRMPRRDRDRARDRARDRPPHDQVFGFALDLDKLTSSSLEQIDKAVDDWFSARNTALDNSIWPVKSAAGAAPGAACSAAGSAAGSAAVAGGAAATPVGTAAASSSATSAMPGARQRPRRGTKRSKSGQ